MSIIFSDDFNTPDIVSGQYRLQSGWSNVTGIPIHEGGVGYGTGVGITGKYCIICTGTAQTRHLFTDTATISVRCMLQWIASSSSANWEPIYIHTIGGVIILMLRGNGQISVRCNNVVSETLFPSATGVFPVDGSAFALQWRMTINSSESISIAVTINNVEVWTHTYTSTDNAGGTDLWTHGSTFNEISLLTTANCAFDNLEIDNSTTDISYPVGVGFMPLGTSVVIGTISSIAMTVGSPNFTITGSNFRIAHSATSTLLPLVRIKDPNNILYYSIPTLGVIEPIVVTSTTITGILEFNVFEGTWCMEVNNTSQCWETSPILSYTCVNISDTVDPPVGTGIYFINPLKATKHDSYYNDIEKKIPNPTITTAGLGE